MKPAIRRTWAILVGFNRRWLRVPEGDEPQCNGPSCLCKIFFFHQFDDSVSKWCIPKVCSVLQLSWLFDHRTRRVVAWDGSAGGQANAGSQFATAAGWSAAQSTSHGTRSHWARETSASATTAGRGLQLCHVSLSTPCCSNAVFTCLHLHHGVDGGLVV